MTQLQQTIEAAFERRDSITPGSVDAATKAAILEAIDLLDSGKARVAEKIAGEWVVHQWLKKAVLLSFRINDNGIIKGDDAQYYDKVPLKFSNYTEEQFKAAGVRVVPPATAQRLLHRPNTVLMPSYVNIGAFVDEGTMVDTWATVGSCAQIGKNVHLSGGVGIGGVLEPLQANPTIIEDNCFIGARSEVVEGVIVEEGSVISMGVFIGQSTRIYDRETGEIHYGRVPAGSVVVPAPCPPSAASTASTPPSSSRRWMPRPAPRSASTPCCAPSTSNPRRCCGDFKAPDERPYGCWQAPLSQAQRTRLG
jgi:2,3,4,5-tetrahydropyridine-2-carboxylate N-succinyltransferase